jgi:hypothetical protein
VFVDGQNHKSHQPCAQNINQKTKTQTKQNHNQKKQAIRNLDDLETMAVPQKYRHLMTFWKYYSGAAAAPVPTLFSAFDAFCFVLWLLGLMY